MESLNQIDDGIVFGSEDNEYKALLMFLSKMATFHQTFLSFSLSLLTNSTSYFFVFFFFK